MKFDGLCQVLTCRASNADDCKRPKNPACYLNLVQAQDAMLDSKPKAVYQSEIVLGQRYRDDDTKFEGVATQVAFCRNGCERVQLRALISSVPVEHWVDAPQLIRHDSNGQAGFSK